VTSYREARVEVAAKVLVLDIERAQGTAVIPFWDLSEMKDRRIQPHTVTEWPRTICAAWKWVGKKQTYFAAEWDPAGREQMLRTIWDAYDEADVVVGHNIKGFDTKKLKSEWLILGLKPPRPYRQVDTLTVARREFGMESNTLDALCVRLGIQGKEGRYNAQVANRACAGSKAAQAELRRYNKYDVLATEALYGVLRGWDSTHPHMGLYSGVERSCYACGSENLVATGETTKTPRTAYATFQCQDCGALSRNNHRKTIVTLVPAR
jgi:hypothetical protein